MFQSFNLIPLLDVAENVGLPFTIAGEDPRRGAAAERIREAIELVDLARQGAPSPGSAVGGRAAAGGDRPRARHPTRPCSSPTSRPATSTSRPAPRSSRRSGGPCVERGQTIVLVTHDAKAAAYADRVLFVQDGRLRDEIQLGRRADHSAAPLIARLAQLGL